MAADTLSIASPAQQAVLELPEVDTAADAIAGEVAEAAEALQEAVVVEEPAPRPFWRIHPDSLRLAQRCDSALFDTVLTLDREPVARTIVEMPVEEVVEEAPPPPPAWMSGLEGTPRTVGVGDNSGVLAIIAGVFILMMLSYKRTRRLFATLGQELWGMRRRANVFDERTSNERQVMGLMGLQWCLCTGLLMYSAFACGLLGHAVLPPQRALPQTAALMGLAAAYYLLQLCAYSLVGYVFADAAGRRLFVQGFTSSQSLLGFALILPALAAIFYPEAARAMVLTGAGLYLAARLVFIIKGFRIFYHNFGSLLYFILYLCTLEIIPLIFVYKIALLLINSL